VAKKLDFGFCSSFFWQKVQEKHCLPIKPRRKRKVLVLSALHKPKSYKKALSDKIARLLKIRVLCILNSWFKPKRIKTNVDINLKYRWLKFLREGPRGNRAFSYYSVIPKILTCLFDPRKWKSMEKNLWIQNFNLVWLILKECWKKLWKFL
jgi:hypothetical protein